MRHRLRWLWWWLRYGKQQTRWRAEWRLARWVGHAAFAAWRLGIRPAWRLWIWLKHDIVWEHGQWLADPYAQNPLCWVEDDTEAAPAAGRRENR